MNDLLFCCKLYTDSPSPPSSGKHSYVEDFYHAQVLFLSFPLFFSLFLSFVVIGRGLEILK